MREIQIFRGLLYRERENFILPEEKRERLWHSLMKMSGRKYNRGRKVKNKNLRKT